VILIVNFIGLHLRFWKPGVYRTVDLLCVWWACVIIEMCKKKNKLEYARDLCSAFFRVILFIYRCFFCKY
jgi:hypothetical protein